jgi:hypothetical protein
VSSENSINGNEELEEYSLDQLIINDRMVDGKRENSLRKQSEVHELKEMSF